LEVGPFKVSSFKPGPVEVSPFHSRFGHFKMQFRELAKMKRNDSARQRSFYTKHLHFDKFVALSVVSVNELWGPVSEAFFKSIKLNGLKISKTPEKMPEP
jgi:hypothetical protein